MCGIVGYIGNKSVAPILLDGLEKLEYRGYDSAGIAVFTSEGITIEKSVGKLAALKGKLSGKTPEGQVGIGHTRWATHGKPSDVNSHPHSDCSGDFVVVHNGIIENYQELKEWLIENGHNFKSETDTEVLPHLVEHYYQGDLVEAVKKVVERLNGSYTIVFMCKQEPHRLVATKKDNPLIVGLGQGENFFASDIPAILNYTRDTYIINDGELVIMTKDQVQITDFGGKPIEKEVYTVSWDPIAAEKGGYDHFMIKEIYEQPKALRETMSGRLTNDNHKVVLAEVGLSKEEINQIQKIYIVACGTAYHAGMVGKYVIEDLARIPVEVDIASEFRYRNPIVDDKTLVIVVSQSGETIRYFDSC